MSLIDIEQARIQNGLHLFVGEFVTEHLTVRARLTSPEIRLSDHLNGSMSTVEVDPFSVEHAPTKTSFDLVGCDSPITKDRLLFVVPIEEPERPRGASNAAWRQTTRHDCWVGIGTYSLSGTLHLEAGRDIRIALRLLDKQFLALTNVDVSAPNGQMEHYPIVIVNRSLIDLLALKNSQ